VQLNANIRNATGMPGTRKEMLAEGFAFVIADACTRGVGAQNRVERAKTPSTRHLPAGWERGPRIRSSVA